MCAAKPSDLQEESGFLLSPLIEGRGSAQSLDELLSGLTRIPLREAREDSLATLTRTLPGPYLPFAVRTVRANGGLRDGQRVASRDSRAS